MVVGFDFFYFYFNLDIEMCDENELVVFFDLELRIYIEEKIEIGVSLFYIDNFQGMVNGGKDKCLLCNILFIVLIFCSMIVIFI